MPDDLKARLLACATTLHKQHADVAAPNDWTKDGTVSADGPYQPTGYALIDAIPTKHNMRIRFGGNAAANAIRGFEGRTAAQENRPVKPDNELHYMFIPNKSAFANPDDYAATLAHEMVHWIITRKRPYASDPRQDLPPVLQLFTPPSQSYAREEIEAEIGAAMLMEKAGVPDVSIERRSRYISNWLNVLPESDREAEFNAAWEKADQDVRWLLEA